MRQKLPIGSTVIKWQLVIRLVAILFLYYYEARILRHTFDLLPLTAYYITATVQPYYSLISSSDLPIVSFPQIPTTSATIANTAVSMAKI